MWLEQKSLSIKFPNPFLFPIGRFLVLHLRKIVLIFSCCKGFPFKPRQSLSYLKMKQTLIKIKNKKDFPAFESFAPKARDLGSIPGQGTRSHILQLRVCMLQLMILHAAVKIEDPTYCAVTEIWCGQISKCFKKIFFKYLTKTFCKYCLKLVR